MADTRTAIGTIINSRGVITATKPNGSERLVSANDWVYANDTLSSQFHAFAEVRLFNGNIFELPSESTVVMADTVSSENSQQVLTPEMIAKIQEAIARGEDPSNIQPAPAAGEGVRETGQIFEPLFIVREGRVVTPESGFESTTFSDDEVPFLFEPGDGNGIRDEFNSIPQVEDATLTASEQNLHVTSPNVTAVTLPIDTGTDNLASVTFSNSQPNLFNSDVRANGHELTFTVSDHEIQAFADGTLIFTVAVSDTGELSYTQHIPFDNVVGNTNDLVESFGISYVVTDDNGDRAEGVIIINVADATPSFEFIEPVSLSESSLLDSPVTFQFGEYSVDAGADGLGGVSFNSDVDYLYDLNLSSNGNLLEFYVDDGGSHLRGHVEGEVVFEAFLRTDGTYKVLLYQPLDHLGSTDELTIPIQVDATDTEGDVTTGILNFTVIDHNNDDACLELTTPEDTPTPLALGTVDAVIGIATDGSTFGTIVTTNHGRIEIVEGVVNYTPTTHFSGTDAVRIQVQTIDGDTYTVNLTLNVTPVADAPVLSVSDSFGQEDTPSHIAINIDELALVDRDGSESLAELEIRLPSTIIDAGGQLYYNGSLLSPTSTVGDSTVFAIANPAFPPSLLYRPPLNDNTDFTVRITATAQESGNNDEATTTKSLTVNVKGVSDLTLAPSGAVSTEEDAGFVTLNVPVSNQDVDGSETLTLWVGPLAMGGEVRIEGLSGTLLPDGRLQFDNVSVEQITNLQFQAPTNASGQFTVPIRVQAVENDANTSDPTDPGVRTLDSLITVTVDPTNDGVTLCAAKTITTEDVPTHLRIQGPTLNETDGSEIIVGQLILSGFPKGSQLFYGDVALADVSAPDSSTAEFKVDAENAHYLSNLLFIPAANSNVDFTASIQITSATVNNATGEILDSITQVFNLPVVVIGDVDAPMQFTQDVTVGEDHWIDLNLKFALTDTDGSESARLLLENVPFGATIDGAEEIAPGQWVITTDNIGDVRLKPPSNSDANFSLKFVAEISENDGDFERFEKTIDVTVEGIADTPWLSAAAAPGMEDQTIALDIRSALIDNDGSETLSIEVRGLPQDFSLSNGELIEGGLWRLNPEQLDGLSIIPPLNRTEDFELTITAITSETGPEIAAGGEAAQAEVTVMVDMTGVADTSTAKPIYVTTMEDTSVAMGLDLHSRLNDIDGSETLSVLLSNVPNGATISGAVALGRGQWSVNAGNLSSVEFVPPHDFSGRVVIGYSVIATEHDGDSASSNNCLVIDVKPVVDMTDVEEDGGLPTLAAQTGSTTLLNLDPGLTDIDGSESIVSVRLYDVPECVTIWDGSAVEIERTNDGYFALTPEQINGASIKPTNNQEDFTLRIQVDVVDSSIIGSTLRTVDISQKIDVTHKDNTVTQVYYECAEAGYQNSLLVYDLADGKPTNPRIILVDANDASKSGDLIATLDGTHSRFMIIANGASRFPELAASNLDFVDNELTVDGTKVCSVYYQDASLNPGGLDHFQEFSNDSGFTIKIEDLPNLGDKDFNDLIIRTKIVTSCEDVPPTSRPLILSKAVLGYEDAPTDFKVEIVPTSSTDTITQIDIAGLPDGVVVQGDGVLGEINGVYKLAPTQLATVQIVTPEHMHGDFSFYLQVTSKTEHGEFLTTTKTIPVSIEAIADKPTIVLAENISGVEDTAIPLSLDARLVDTDGSEYLTARIYGIPQGAALNVGVNNGDGSWTVAGDILNDLTITPPKNFSGTMQLKLEAIAAETSNGSTESRSTLFTVEVEAAADRPDLVADLARGIEDQWVALDIDANLRDTDGSEVLEIVLSGYPDGTQFNVGSAGSATDTWVVKPNDLATLQVRGPEHFSGTLNVTVMARSHEPNGQTAVSTLTLAIILAAVADAPTLAADVQDASLATASDGSPIQIIPVSFLPGLVDVDSSESLTGITLSGLPPEAHVTNGENQGVGRWYLPFDLSANAEIVIDANHSGSYDITTEISSFEHSNGDIATTTTAFNLRVQSLQVLKGNDEITGSDADESLRGGAGNDSLDGGEGADNLYGDEGDDTFFFDPHDNIVDGGTGVDTLVIRDDFELDLCAANLENLESIDVAEGASVNITLNVADVLNMTDHTNQLLVNGDNDDTVNLEGSWTQATDQTTEGYITYSGEYNSEVATLLVDSTIHVMG